ncbi:MAG: hypothetical protein Q4G16_03600 [Cruoricaptor ignavus]|nr:hypothetical protein [Cruoricaptor ignavus]
MNIVLIMKNNLYIFLFLCCTTLGLAQEKPNYKLGFFTSLQADMAFDLGTILRPNRDANDYYSQYDDDKTYFTYGFNAQLGYQPLNWFALAGGIRYAYITSKYHNLYWTIQPYFFITDPMDKDFGYFTLTLGSQFNKTQGLSNNGFLGIGIGKFDLVNDRFAQKIQINLDVQSAD